MTDQKINLTLAHGSLQERLQSKEAELERLRQRRVELDKQIAEAVHENGSHISGKETGTATSETTDLENKKVTQHQKLLEEIALEEEALEKEEFEIELLEKKYEQEAAAAAELTKPHPEKVTKRKESKKKTVLDEAALPVETETGPAEETSDGNEEKPVFEVWDSPALSEEATTETPIEDTLAQDEQIAKETRVTSKGKDKKTKPPAETQPVEEITSEKGGEPAFEHWENENHEDMDNLRALHGLEPVHIEDEAAELPQKEEEKNVALNEFNLPEGWAQEESVRALEEIREKLRENENPNLDTIRSVIGGVIKEVYEAYTKYDDTIFRFRTRDPIDGGMMDDFTHYEMDREEKLAYLNKRFPNGMGIKGTSKHLKWSALVDYEIWVIIEYHATLTSTRQRGGLTPQEILYARNALVQGKSSAAFSSSDDIIAWLEEHDMLQAGPSITN